jgi:hypothetical protein
MILLAYGITHNRDRFVRSALTAALVVVTISWGCRAESLGEGLWTKEQYGKAVVEQLDALAQDGRLQEGDIVLFRPGFLEGDLRPGAIPVENRAALEGVLRAQLATLYAPRDPRPLLVLTYSNRRGTDLYAAAGRHYDPSQFYTAVLAAELRHHRRLWLVSHPVDRDKFIDCFLGWLRDATGDDWRILGQWPPPAATQALELQNDRGPNSLSLVPSQEVPDGFTQITLISRVPP